MRPAKIVSAGRDRRKDLNYKFTFKSEAGWTLALSASPLMLAILALLIMIFITLIEGVGLDRVW